MKTTLKERKHKISLIEAYLRQWFQPFEAKVEHSCMPFGIQFRAFRGNQYLAFSLAFNDLDYIPLDHLKQFVFGKLSDYENINRTTQN
jgi:hypothetical protein